MRRVKRNKEQEFPLQVSSGKRFLTSRSFTGDPRSPASDFIPLSCPPCNNLLSDNRENLTGYGEAHNQWPRLVRVSPRGLYSFPGTRLTSVVRRLQKEFPWQQFRPHRIPISNSIMAPLMPPLSQKIHWLTGSRWRR